MSLPEQELVEALARIEELEADLKNILSNYKVLEKQVDDSDMEICKLYDELMVARKSIELNNHYANMAIDLQAEVNELRKLKSVAPKQDLI